MKKILGTGDRDEAQVHTPVLQRSDFGYGAQGPDLAQADSKYYRAGADSGFTNWAHGAQNADLARALQAQQISQLQDQAAGKGPSLAGQQLGAALQANNAAAQGMAASASPNNLALAGRSAMMAQASNGQATAQQAAMARTQEQYNAQQALGAALSAQRGGDLAQQQSGAQVAGMYNNAYGSVMNAQQQGMSDWNKSQADATIKTQQQGLDLSKENTAYQREDAKTPLNVAGDILALGGIGAFSDARLKKNVSVVPEDEQHAFLDALSAKRYDYKDERHAAGLGAFNGDLAAGPMKNGLFQALSAKHAADEREKAAGGRHVGVMAQDLEGTRMGRTIVNDTPEGKTLDVRNGLGLALAAMGGIHERVKRLEGDV